MARNSGFAADEYGQLSLSYDSALAVLPYLLDLLPIRSVLDVGCGTGAWLAAAKALGCLEVLGLEGGEIPEDLLLISRRELLAVDVSEPIDLQRKFDLVMSLEVAEHLLPERASQLVANIQNHSDLVLFSAAIPGQQGSGHINCQWPDYWSAMFAEVGYTCFDAIRSKVWCDDRVEVWYRQNVLLFARGVPAERLSLAGMEPTEPQALVHPELWVWTANELARLQAVSKQESS